MDRDCLNKVVSYLVADKLTQLPTSPFVVKSGPPITI